MSDAALTALSTPHTDRDDHPVRDIVAVCVGLAFASLLFNLSFSAEMQGRMQEWSFVRKSVTKVLNSGTAWAAVGVYAGWRMRRLPWALVAGVAASVGSLVVYTVIDVVAIHGAPGQRDTNAMWFIAALLFGAPLGFAGWLARRRDALGVLGRLVVPVGAVAEPWVLGMFDAPYPGIPWAERWSDHVSGAVLFIAGLVGVVWVLVRAWQPRATDRPRVGRGR